MPDSRSAALLLLISLMLCACGQSSRMPVLSGGEQPAPAFARHLPFPVDRELAALSTTTIDGSATAQRSSGAVDQGSSLLITAAALPEYGIYTFSPKNTPNQVTVTMSSAQTGAYWVALANYTKGYWELDGPYASSQGFALGAQHLSPLGNFSVAVLAPPHETAQVELLQLSANNDPPVADIQATADGPAPLTVNFDANGSSDLEGPIINYAWEYESGGGFTSTGTTAVSTHDYMVQGTYTARVRVTDSGGLVAFDSVIINAGAPTNTPPNAVLTGPADAAAPFMANFDASGSNDPDAGDSITNYSWDLDNDGQFNQTGAEQAVEGLATASLNLTAPGSYTVSVKVTDETGGLGGTATASYTVVATGWKFATISAQDNSGEQAMWLAEINGVPGVAYQYIDPIASTRELRYAYSTTPTGSNDSDWQNVTIPAVIHGGRMGLAEISGAPAISYYGNFRLQYARPTTPQGASPADWTIVSPDDVMIGSGFNSSVASINGHPAIAYERNTADTAYVYSASLDGMLAGDWSAPIIIDGEMWNSGGDLSLAEIDGNPAIAYRDQETGTRLKYARANNATGTPAAAWTDMGSSKLVIDASPSLWGQLQDVNGNPAIAYWSAVNDDLYYAYSSTATGSLLADWTLVPVDTGAGLAGAFPTLAVVDGRPAIASFSSDPNNDILFTRSSTASGSQAADWPASSTPVVSDGAIGYYSCMASINGHAAIIYYDGAPNFDLKYAILFE